MQNNVDSKKKLLSGTEKVSGGANDESTEQKGIVGMILHTLNFRLLEVSNIIIKSGHNHPEKLD